MSQLLSEPASLSPLSLSSFCDCCVCCCSACRLSACCFSSQPSNIVVVHTTTAPRLSQTPGTCRQIITLSAWLAIMSFNEDQFSTMLSRHLIKGRGGYGLLVWLVWQNQHHLWQGSNERLVALGQVLKM